MLIGSSEWPAQEFALFILFILCLIFNTFLFYRYHHSYSIKYELMKQHRFFRVHQCALYAVEGIYKFFFVMPFLVLAAIAILRGLYKPIECLPIFVNGMIILLILYPNKRQFYFVKEVALWFLALASQLITLFLYDNAENYALYTQLSSIFLTTNCMLFGLAILSREDVYWEIKEAIMMCKDKIQQVNPLWVSQKSTLPTVFNGGIYGLLCKKKKYKVFLILYFVSLSMLGLNAFFVWWCDNSYLGVVQLVSNIVYDIFVLTFTSLGTSERTMANIFVLIFAGRLLSFVFGSQFWIFGYCVLYLFIGVFIGRIIIQRRLPMKFQSNKLHHQTINALKTPQFVILLLTVEIMFLVLAQSLGISAALQISYNEVEIPVWQFGLIVVIATWVIILYLASKRMINRHTNKIHGVVEYYFGLSFVQEYHIYIVVTYLAIIGLGVYIYLVLLDSTTFISCIFIPLIYLTLDMILGEWVNNDYMILADTEDYNVKTKKLYDIQAKKKDVLKNKQKHHVKTFKKRALSVLRNDLSKIQTFQALPQKSNEMNETGHRLSVKMSEASSESQSEQAIGIKAYSSAQIEPFVQLKNWRTQTSYMSVKDYWNNFTASDKKILIGLGILLLLLVAFCLCSKLVSQSHFGISLSISLICYLTLISYYKLVKCVSQLLIGELILSICGVVLGMLYWGFNYNLIGYAIVWAAVYSVLCAWLFVLGVQKGMQLLPKVMLSCFSISLILFICIFIGFTVSKLAAVIMAVIVFILLVCLIPIYHLYVHEQIPLYAKLIPGITVPALVIAAAILAFALKIASNFAIFTFTMGFIYISLFAVASIIAIQKQLNRYNHPHVYSSYGDPAYRFESENEKLKSSRNHLVIYQFSSVVLVVYAACITLIFEEKYMAIYALTLYLAQNFFQDILYTIKSYYEIALERKHLTPQLISSALADVQEKYMADEVAGKNSDEFIEEFEQKKKDVADMADPDLLNTTWKDIVRLHQEIVKNQEEEEKFLFFWIVLIQFHLYSERKAFMLKTINEVKQIEQELMDVGIYISSVNSNLNFEAKFVQVTKEIEALNPFDFIVYEEVIEKHRQDEKQKREEAKISAEKALLEQQEKEKELFERLKREEKKKPSGSSQIDEFKELLRSIGKKNLYTDPQFPANENSVGEMLAPSVSSWRRPKPHEVLSKNGFSPYDVKQGAIGDCYLISSFGVLGDRWISEAFGMKEGGQQLWTNGKGAYMVRFYKFLKEVYVIVDDHLPVNSQDEWVFAKSEDTSEFWPAILEKAYAKLYSGYDKIIEGKCHRVLAEFTGGFPFQILLETYKNNPNALWSKIIGGKNHGYLLGAGSPSNQKGDSVCSKRGIVQKHAYAVLDARQADQYKLIKLKNPQGSGGKEWLGDFSDSSTLMTKRMMSLLDHVQADDGIFWMTLEDFIYQFKFLYICAVFQKGWTKIQPIQGAFTRQNSFGTPNLSSNTYKNPQYGVTVSKKSTLFINFTQQAKTALKGKNYIYVRIQKNDGKRISKQNVSSQKLCGNALSPSNTVSISTEVVLQAESYPYTFTVYVSCLKEGDTGSYTLEMYCNDQSVKIIDDLHFDRGERD